MGDTDNFKSKFLKSSGEEFFKLLEEHLQATIPSMVKKNLSFSDFNCAVVISKLDDASIISMEEDIRTNFNVSMLDAGAKAEEYLGRFSKFPQKFTFLSGQRKWLELLAETCRRFVSEISPSPAATTGNVAATTQNAESSNPSTSNVIILPIPHHVHDQDIRDLKNFIFLWISSQTRLPNSVKQNVVFRVMDQPEIGKVLVKCPIHGCNEHIPVFFASLPKNTVSHSTPRWYIYAVHAHILKFHFHFNFSDFRDENHDANRNERNLHQRIENRDIPETDGNSTTSKQNSLKRKIRSTRVVKPNKKYKM